VTDLDASDLVTSPPQPRRRARWKAVVTLAGLVGLAIAAYATVGDTRDLELPGRWVIAGALALQLVALWFAGRGWVVLFPPDADRASLTAGLYMSQLTKYLPAGGFVQVASQVALSGSSGGMAVAAIRLPVYLLCFIVAALTFSAGVALDGDLPPAGRVLAGLCLLSLVVLDRRVLDRLLHAARRVVKRLPEPDHLPPQRAIVRCYLYGLGNMAAYSAAFVLLLGAMTDARPTVTAAALALGWAAGFFVFFIPSGLVVREAVILAVVPSLAAAPLLAASVAHRLAGLLAEATMAGGARLRAVFSRRASHTPAS
jgi:glycosyltransferase 2 family protein